jgi:tRNA A37 N6-isopentenylltransferase MiaA
MTESCPGYFVRFSCAAFLEKFHNLLSKIKKNTRRFSKRQLTGLKETKIQNGLILKRLMKLLLHTLIQRNNP